MKVLFAVHDEKVSLSIVKKYQKEYKEIISYKNVYYFNAILKELQRDKTYDRVVIDEELEEFSSTSYAEKDKFIFNKLDNITDEASNSKGKDIPIILICTERRAKSDEMLVKLFGIGIYNAIIGNDRSTDEVCRLINSPRSKKDAKTYYKISSKSVEYDPEHENDVSEEEMQHILSYFKRLGKNEQKYVESFRKIVSQYNNQQMKIIIAILPENVKAILEENSLEYQKLVSKPSRKNSKKTPRKVIDEEPTSEKLLDANQRSNSSPIVIPSSIDKSIIKKINIKKPSAIRNVPTAEDEEEIQDEIIPEEPKKKRRGRPPKKKIQEEVVEKEQEVEDEFSELLSDIDDYEENNLQENKREITPIDESLLRPEPISENILPGLDDDFEDDEDDEYDYNSYNGLYEDDEDNSLPGIKQYEEDDNEVEDHNSIAEKDEEDDDENNSLPGIEEYEDISIPGIEEDDYDEVFSNPTPKTKSTTKKYESDELNTSLSNYNSSYNDFNYSNYNSLLSGGRKVIAFVGTSKNGTSFIVNNIAKILSESGIDTAILDVTQNKNSYYIYNNNEDSLRNAAATSIERLIKGEPGGMRVSKNLSVYVDVPDQENENMYNVGPILENIAKNHSAILIDCDFSTPKEYFANAQEIYLVQSMDVLTIQPLTAFLKELKNRDALDQNKIRIIINKAMRLRGITPKQIVGGMSRYNNPEMSMMTELFDRNLIVPIEIPFDVEVYAKYVEGLAECNISVSKYPKDFQNILKRLSAVIYPLLPAKRTKDKPQKGYQYSNGFSNSVNNTLNNMKKKY